WVIEAREHDLPVNDEMIQMKAHHFSVILGIKMKFSDGWMTKFKKRYNIWKVTLHGEVSSVNPDDVASARAQLLEITKDYEPHNIYNADESGLCYHMPPNKVLATEQKAGVKDDKSQITYLLCANADGTHKLNPLVIGSSAKPKSFRGKPAHYYGFQYTSNKNAWVTGQIFGDWLQKLDYNFCKEGQKILLLLDNFPGHKAPVKTLNLTNIDVYFIPLNLTSHLQPCDAGIIAAWKAHY
ncbi:hypothetical protein CROQUDRAFT_35912, partial [Cronartium quercuum f. sp. fusiforme G11]